jgi:hypothetical protein
MRVTTMDGVDTLPLSRSHASLSRAVPQDVEQLVLLLKRVRADNVDLRRNFDGVGLHPCARHAGPCATGNHTRTHRRIHAHTRTHVRTHANTRTRTHTHAHTRTHTHATHTHDTRAPPRSSRTCT